MTGRILTVITAATLLGIGFFAGVYLHETPFSRVVHANTCASDKQFLAAFQEPGYDGWGSGVYRTTIEVDGQKLGPLDKEPKRRFFCEGNHEAKIIVARRGDNQTEEEYRFDFALSRPSVFYAERYGGSKTPDTCVTRPRCSADFGLALTSLDPDDPKLRAMLRE